MPVYKDWVNNNSNANKFTLITCTLTSLPNKSFPLFCFPTILFSTVLLDYSLECRKKKNPRQTLIIFPTTHDALEKNTYIITGYGLLLHSDQLSMNDGKRKPLCFMREQKLYKHSFPFPLFSLKKSYNPLFLIYTTFHKSSSVSGLLKIYITKCYIVIVMKMIMFTANSYSTSRRKKFREIRDGQTIHVLPHSFFLGKHYVHYFYDDE